MLSVAAFFLQSFSYITQPTKVEYVTLKKDTCDETSAKMVPDNVLSKVDIIHFFPHKFCLSIFSIWSAPWIILLNCGGCENNSRFKSHLRASWPTCFRFPVDILHVSKSLELQDWLLWQSCGLVSVGFRYKWRFFIAFQVFQTNRLCLRQVISFLSDLLQTCKPSWAQYSPKAYWLRGWWRLVDP